MKRLILFLLLMPCIADAQNYVGKADSCMKRNDYVCAAVNYDLYLTNSDSSSNGIAYRSAVAWAKAGDKDKTINAVKVYIRNNALNNYPFFSKELEAESSFDFLKTDSRWISLLSLVKNNENAIRLAEKKKVDSAVAIQRSLERRGLLSIVPKLNATDAKSGYSVIKNYNGYPAIKSRMLSLQFKITDSLNTAFLVVLPPKYDAKKSYAVLFFLHGAVGSNTGYLNYADDWDTQGWNRYYTKYSGDVIMVYPHGNRDYNWMYPEKGFYMLPAMLRQMKNIINVDDNRVYISGHSNGATGSFSYLVKQPSPFAAFYGFNTWPRVATGGTYLRNILNRSFFNVSTDQDYYFPPEAHDTLSLVMKALKVDYQDHRYNGFPHWFPQFDESEPVYKTLFDDLAARKRNPFRTNLYWECDDVKYGNCDWLTITALDTASQRAAWHTDVNFGIHKWLVLDKKNRAIEHDTMLNAYSNVKKSGAIKATYLNNVFSIETSAVKAFSILISPEMVDLKKPVTIKVNGKVYSTKKYSYDKSYMLAGFNKTLDRKALWINHIDVVLK
nr:hypothetical protein [uncultured Mucilaginibacter sp.]